MRIQTACMQCSGRGSVSKQACKACNSRGQVVKSHRDVDVRIPPGVEDGMQIRLSGEGAGGGDLYVVVNVEKHPSLERHQRNILGSLEVPYHILVLGGEASFRLFDLEISIKVPPRTRSGSRLRIKGQGMPAIHNSEIRGDLFVELQLKMPNSITKEQEKAILDLAKLDSAN